MSEQTIKGQKYRVGKLNAIQQFHVVRRLAPVLWAMFSAAAGAGAVAAEDMTDEQAILAVGPLTTTLSKMSDEDSEYVLRACLGAVSREDSGKFAPVMAKGGGLMYDDIDMGTMMGLAFAVIKENLGNFLDALPEKAKQAPSAT